MSLFLSFSGCRDRRTGAGQNSQVAGPTEPAIPLLPGDIRALRCYPRPVPAHSQGENSFFFYNSIYSSTVYYTFPVSQEILV